MLNFTFNNITPIGLDCGHGGVRAAQLRRNRDSWTIIGFGRVERARLKSAGQEPSSSAAEGTHQSPDELWACLSQSRFRGKEAVLGLNHPPVEYLSLELPAAILNAATADGGSAIRFEVERLAATSAAKGSLVTSHWPLPSTTVAAPNALGVAASEEAVVDALQCAESAGLRCSCVEPPAIPLCRFATLLNDWPADVVTGLLDLGFDQTRLMLMADGVPLLMRVVGPGGGARTRRIAASLGVSLQAAEVLKREHGISPTQLGSVLSGILRGEFNEIAAEIKKSYEYVLSCYPSRRPGDLVLCGGGAAMPHWGELLQETLNVPVHRAQAYFETSTCRLRPGTAGAEGMSLDGLSLAIGLALGESD